MNDIVIAKDIMTLDPSLWHQVSKDEMRYFLNLIYPFIPFHQSLLTTKVSKNGDHICNMHFIGKGKNDIFDTIAIETPDDRFFVKTELYNERVKS